jgi:hypothetical protein
MIDFAHVHAQIVRERHESLIRSAELHRLVTPTPRCSWFRRLAIRLGAVSSTTRDCGRRPKPGLEAA